MSDENVSPSVSSLVDDAASVASAVSVSGSEKSVSSGAAVIKKSGIPKASGLKPPTAIKSAPKIDRPCHDHCTPKPALPPDVKRELNHSFFFTFNSIFEVAKKIFFESRIKFFCNKTACAKNNFIEVLFY